jgi:uncharacterized lipoprotein YajG
MRILGLMAIAALLSGCALTEDKVVVRYEAPANISVTKGADQVVLQVVSVEGRVANRDRVSTKKNGYGMEMARILAANDVVTEVGNAVQVELSSLGFKIGPGGIVVRTELSEFYNDFKMGFFAGDAVAQVAFNLTAKQPDGTLIYSRTYKAVGFNKNTMMASGDAARPALMQALRDSVQQMVQDTDFHQALVKAGTPVQKANAPTS